MATSKNSTASTSPARDNSEDFEDDEPQTDMLDDDQDDDQYDDDEQDQDTDEDEDEAPAPRRGRGRPVAAARTRNRPAVMSVTAVFKDKDEAEYHDLLEEAGAKNASVSAYALEVLLNRHNTATGATDNKRTIRALRERVSQLEGAKETLQGLYEDAMKGIKTDSLAGFDNAPVTNKTLASAVQAEIARMEKERLAAEAPELRKQLDKLQEEYDELEDRMEKESSLMSRAQILAPAAINGLMQRAPGLANALAGLAGIEPMGLPAGPAAESTDSLVLAALRTRDNVAPKQVRELEQVLDAVARHPQFISRFAQAVQQFEAAQATAEAHPG